MKTRAAGTIAFGHRPQELRFWRGLVEQAVAKHASPFYLFSIEPIREAMRELRALDGKVPVRHWLSFKTQPVRPLLQWWQRQGRGVEVVSEFELLAALREGFSPEQIIVNGPAKHTWLTRHRLRGLLVNFDSFTEARALVTQARVLDWQVGARIHTREEFDPEHPGLPTQFGMQREEALAALKFLHGARVRLEMVQFHLRTNVAEPAIYVRALREVAQICRQAKFAPKYLDCGGGFPPPHVRAPNGNAYDARFELTALAQAQQQVLRQFPGVRELWLENGRFVSARSGVLVVRVRDVKPRQKVRQLICDGGRTTHALISNWEAHEIFTVPRRSGVPTLTAVCGATCMAFDQLTRRALPRSVRPGDYLVWMEAGAYHVPWETRFSHGYAKVLWHDGDRIRVAREAESFEKWWGQWK